MFADIEKTVDLKALQINDILRLGQSCEFKPLTFFSELYVIDMVKSLESRL